MVIMFTGQHAVMEGECLLPGLGFQPGIFTAHTGVRN
jgi:hypothetical protein